MERLLTVEELSGMLRVSTSTVYRWIHCDFVPYIKMGNVVRFDEKSILRWLKARECKGRTGLFIKEDTLLRD